MKTMSQVATYADCFETLDEARAELARLRDTAERYRMASLKWEAQAMRWRTVAEGLDRAIEARHAESIEWARAEFERAKRHMP